MRSGLRLGFRLGNALLFVGCCFLVADVANEVSAGLLQPSAMPAVDSPQLPPPSVPSWAEREPILDRNLFGSRVAAVPPPPEPEEELEKTELPVELAGTLSSPSRQARMASIWHSDRREYQVLRPGDSLDHHPGVELARIERGRVVLRNGEELEELLLEDRADRVRVSKTTMRQARREKVRELRRAREIARRNRAR